MKFSFKNVIESILKIKTKNNRVLTLAISSVAVVLTAVIIITTILSGSGTVSKDGDLMKGISTNRVKNARVTDGFSEIYANFCLTLLANSDKESNIAFAPSNVMSAVVLMAHASDSNARLEIEKSLGMETIEMAKQISSIESRIKYKEKKKTGLNYSNNILMNNSVVYGVRKKFLKDNAKYFGLGIDRLSFADAKGLKKVFEQYSQDVNYASTINYEVDKLQYMNILSNAHFSAEWEKATSEKDTSNELFQGIKHSVGTTFFKFMTDSYIEGGVYKGFTKKLKGGFTFVGLLPDNQQSGEYYGIDMIFTELSETGQFKDIASTAMDDTEVAVWMPRYNSDVSVAKNTLFSSAIKNMGIKTIFEKDAGFNNFAEVSSNLHVSEIAVAGSMNISPAGVCDAFSKNTKSEAEKIDKCENQLMFNREFVYFIVDDKTGLPIYCGILRNID